MLQCCGLAVRERRKRFEGRGWRQKVRMSNFKVQNPNEKIEMSNVKSPVTDTDHEHEHGPVMRSAVRGLRS